MTRIWAFIGRIPFVWKWGASTTLGMLYALAYYANGLGWLEFASYPDNLVYSQMRSAEGVIVGVTISGWGDDRDFLVSIEGSKEEFLFPGLMTRAAFTPDDGPLVQLKEVLRKGNRVKLRTSGGRRGVILELFEATEGSSPWKIILPYQTGAFRYRQIHSHARELSESSIRKSQWVGAGVLLASLMILGLRRKFLPKSSPS